MDFNQLVAEYQALKIKVDSLAEQVSTINQKADAETDSILAKIQKSSVSWLIVLGYTAGAIAFGAYFF